MVKKDVRFQYSLFSMNLLRKMLSTTVILTLPLLFVACEQSPNTPKETAATVVSQLPEKVVLAEKPMDVVKIKWRNQEQRQPQDIRLQDPSSMTRFVDGKAVKMTDTPLDEFLLEFGKISFRKGTEFFPDWEISVTVKQLRPNSTISLVNSQVIIQEKPEGASLPTTNYLTDAKGKLVTGELTSLGMPIQIQLSAISNDNDKLNYEVVGAGFAVVGDIRVKDGQLDNTYDSLKTTELIAKNYLQQHEESGLNHNLHSVSNIMRSKRDVGIDALVVFGDSEQLMPLKRVELTKVDGKWEADSIIPYWKVREADRLPRKRESDQLKVMAAKRTEQFLQANNFNQHLYTNVSCRVVDNIGLCHIDTKVWVAGEQQCLLDAYLFNKSSSGWVFDKKVNVNLKLDAKTKTLIEDTYKKRKTKELILDKAMNLLIGKCH